MNAAVHIRTKETPDRSSKICQVYFKNLIVSLCAQALQGHQPL